MTHATTSPGHPVGDGLTDTPGPAPVGPGLRPRRRGKLVNPAKQTAELHGCLSLWPPADLAASAERDDTVTQTSGQAQLGFLTVLHEASGYLGGYLVTNIWGRPVEFRLSTAVQPNRVQQILYGHTLHGYLHGELIGKTLVEKTASSAGLIFTDRLAVLELRNTLDLPIVWVASDDPAPEESGLVVRPATADRPALVTHRKHPNDLPRIREVLDQLDSHLDLVEPFARIREAIAEARKLGVTSRG